MYVYILRLLRNMHVMNEIIFETFNEINDEIINESLNAHLHSLRNANEILLMYFCIINDYLFRINDSYQNKQLG